MPRRLAAFACAATLLALTPGCGSKPPDEPEVVAPEPEPPEPPEPDIPRRGRVCLNGRWRFMPAVGPAGREPAGEWGTIFVPGSWSYNASPPVPIKVDKPGTGPGWDDFRGESAPRVWYEHVFRIPKRWEGLHVELDFRRVSTDAVVWVNGKECGEVLWPTGTVDVTDAVTPGEEALLRVLVVATPDPGEVAAYMATAEGPVSKRGAELEARGIIGEVFLNSRPRGAHVADVFVRTSTREKTISLDVELSGVEEAGEVSFVARAIDLKGGLEKEFNRTVRVEAAGIQRVELTWEWGDPRLWDFRRPELYTLELHAKGVGLDDVYRQRFGFREFRVEGKSFFLNGKEIRLRPTLQHAQGGNVQEIDAGIDEAVEAGFNIQLFRPSDLNRRGTLCYMDLIAERADLKGWPITGIAQGVNGFVERGWDGPGVREEYERVMRRGLRRLRNHPSIVMWGTSGDLFGHGRDQNPRLIGRRGWADREGQWRKRADAGAEGVTMIKRFDPTRPVFTHGGAYVGDVYTVNCYLNLIPLQEREEWLSEWAASGEMPLMFAEFGLPADLSLRRGRNGRRLARQSESLMTEFCAVYLGREAFEKEPADYREQIRSENRALKMTGRPAFDELQRLFIRNTWRSWRTWGVTGGMVPWQHAYRERVPGTGTEEHVPLRPGSRGVYDRKRLVGPEYRVTSRGEPLREVNSETLAWIAGAANAFTAKEHHFYDGEKVEKQAVLINDSRETKSFEATWHVTVGGREIHSGGKKGEIGVAKTVFVPVSFTAPAVAEKTPGRITLVARIGDSARGDTFEFRVYPRPALSRPPVIRNGAEPDASSPEQVEGLTVIAFDPEGDTSRMLASVGVETKPWEGEFGVGAPVLVIGRGAFDKGRQPPGSVERFVASGGRAVMFSQDPEWFRKVMGVRVCRHVSRRAWPVQTQMRHPIVTGLDGQDLRDWRGSGTLVRPRSGRHWGNRGSVTSVALEKPHHAGFRPILECEFDLAYTPLMELCFGEGLFVLCTLDLEGRAGLEPVADILARRIIDHAAAAEIEPRAAETFYLGGEEGEGFLKQIGLVYHKTDSVPDRPGLLTVGPDVALPDGQFERFMKRGGSVFFAAREDGTTEGPDDAAREVGTTEGPDDAAREAGALPLGFKAQTKRDFAGSLEPPNWPETTGLSASDTRLRAGVEATVLVSGPGEVASSGLFARLECGNGKAIFVQMLPSSLDAARETFLRYSQWRLARANVQVLAGMGAELLGDTRVFLWEKSPFDPIPLAGEWKWRPSRSEGRPADRGEAEGWHEHGFDDAGWESVRVPLAYSAEPAASAAKAGRPRGASAGPLPAPLKQPRRAAKRGLRGPDDGAVWFRKVVKIPLSWRARELVLSLGRISGRVDTYFNGTRLGSVRGEDSSLYALPPDAVRPGWNVIAVRVAYSADATLRSSSLRSTRAAAPAAKAGSGRVVPLLDGEAEEMIISVPGRPEGQNLYYPGFRTDLAAGDDPYRYYRR